MSRLTPRTFGKLTGLGEKGLKGLYEIGEKIGVRANTAAVMAGVLEAARSSNLEYRVAIGASLEANNQRQQMIQKAGTFITLVRENVKPAFGSRYSEAWGTVGFFNKTLSVPRSLEQRLALLGAIELFFVNHPAMEIPNVVTAALAAALRADLATAMAGAMRARVEQRQMKTVRDAAVTTLRKRIQGLYAELKVLLAPNDPRWLNFGFKVPTDISVPAAPEGLVLTVQDSGHVKASWGHTVHADRYRVYQRVGMESEYVLLATTTGTSFNLGTFASGTHLDVQVRAVNAVGESQASESVKFVFGKDERGTFVLTTTLT